MDDPNRSEDSISTKSSHHTNVMLRKHSEGRHSERSRQEHSSNRKRSVRLILNYLEMYIVHTKYARVLLYWEYKRTLACLVHTLRFDKIMCTSGTKVNFRRALIARQKCTFCQKTNRQMTTIIES